jgi:hypothetical protein
MSSTLETTRADASARRDRIRSQLGRKTAAEIRAWVTLADDRDWALTVADGLAVSGFLTLSDVTDDEFDDLLV